jgi:hypothetical protein
MPPLVISRDNITIGGKILETSKSIGLTPKVEAIPALLTEERMYPPVRNVSSKNHSISGQSYGNGIYVINESTTYGAYHPYNCFNTSDATGGAWADNRYIQPNGTFRSSLTDNIVHGYTGDWLKIKFPVAINLTRYSFRQRTGSTGLLSRAPQDFKIYGSNDEINWIEITHETIAVYVSNSYETTISTLGTYNSFGLVVNKLVGNNSGAHVLNFDEWFIYGMEKLDPNNYSLVPFHEPINDDYKYIPFVNTGANQTSYNIHFSENTECDILIVAGGGGGDGQIGGGGGGGAVLYAQGVIIQPNTYTINVGKGGAENNNGNNTTAFGATCLGGGSTLRVNWSTKNDGRSGGSGSGGSGGGGNTGSSSGGGVGTSTKGSLLSTGTLYNGNSGGSGGNQVNVGGGAPICSGGGGGANQVGKSTTNTVRYNNASNYTAWFNAGSPGAGGDGILVNITGTNYYWGGGGGGGSYQTLAGTGGLGGGGGGSQFDGTTPQLGGIGINNGSTGVNGGKGGDGGASTGGGGGGGGWQNTNGGNGGSGIVIIRYKIIKIPFESQWTYNPSNLNVYHLGNVGIGTINPTSALDVLGSVVVNGGISTNSYIASTKTFKIEHPLNINKWLYHGCIEAPRFDNIYRGKKMLINGTCEVDIDSECNTTGGMTAGTFMALNNNFSLHLQNKNSFDGVKGEIIDGKIIISCENIAEEIEVEWLVIGERHDEGIVRNNLTNNEGMLICEHEY